MEGFSSGVLHIPQHPVEPFETALNRFNEKVAVPSDYPTWRRKIMARVTYIKTREKMGKKAPWYK